MSEGVTRLKGAALHTALPCLGGTALSPARQCWQHFPLSEASHLSCIKPLPGIHEAVSPAPTFLWLESLTRSELLVEHRLERITGFRWLEHRNWSCDRQDKKRIVKILQLDEC